MPGVEPRPDPATGTVEADRLIGLGNAAEDSGHLAEACAHYRKAITIAPRYGRAHLNLGIGLEASGDVDGAAAAFEAAIAMDPESANAGYNLGRLLYSRGELPRAAELLRAALERKAGFAEAHVVLSSVLHAQGSLQPAVAELEAALALRPDWNAVHVDYARLLIQLGRTGDAEAALRKALKEQPDLSEAHFTLSDVLDAKGDAEGAAAALERALALRPDWAQALNNYGVLLHRLQRLPQAEAALRRAIAVEPGLSNAYRTLGAILINQCRIDDAIEMFRVGRQHDPQGFDLESAELFALNLSDQTSSETIFARHRAFGTRLESAYPRRFPSYPNARDPNRRLRIGYLSPDFCNHGVALFTLPLVERHDRDKCEVHCYHAGTMADDYTRALRESSDVWRDVPALSHAELADVIHRDGIDILVDLAGHTGPTLPVFALAPAPVQASWLGYLCTTGLSRIQYRLCDAVTDPEDSQRLHTETLIRLPGSQWCYRPRTGYDYRGPALPPRQTNGYVTFGSFNHAPKLSRSVLSLWARILVEVPDSRLVLVGIPEGAARDAVTACLAGAGVAADRLLITGRVPLQDYFRRLGDVDLALDTTPYSGGTTTCDSLWMGTPVLTLPQSRPVSRSAAGILSVAGLTEWIASSPDDYVARAVAFARNGETLATRRDIVRAHMRESPLMDEPSFAHHVEDAYRQMWRAWCENRTP